MIVKKLAAATPKAVTANRLTDGIVVWLARSGTGWVEHFADAGIFTADESEAALATAKEDERRRLVVDAYLIDVEPTPAGPRALRYREQLRALGPSVRTDLGKQAEAPAATEIREAS